MSTINKRSYQNPRNLNVKGQGVGRGGIVRIEGTNSSNPLDSTSNGLYVNEANRLVVASQGKTLPVGSDFTEIVTATNVITAAESGAVFFLNSTTEFVSTLPLPAAGLHFTFIVSGAPSGASYTVVTSASANIIKGQIHSSTGGDADSEVSGGDTLSFVDGAAVAGDMAEFWCDGTNWFTQAFCNADTGITITTAS